MITRPQTLSVDGNMASLAKPPAYQNNEYRRHGTSPSPSRHKSMDFGKFYQTSYLDMNGNVVKKGSVSSPNLKSPAGFHRPDNFSYSKAPPRFKKAKRPGMLDLLRDSPRLPKSPSHHKRNDSATERALSPERPPETEKVIKLSHYPSAELRKDKQPAIEREDWPAPPASAVTTKNLVRTTPSLTRTLAEEEEESDESEEAVRYDSKIQRELLEIKKIQDSAMAKYIAEDLTEQIQQDKKKLLDPRSASRTPSASKEPVQPPRFVSPVNASPSRNLMERPRFISESAVGSTSPVINGASRPPIVHGTTTSSRYKLKPGYSFGYISKSLSNVPPGTPGAYVYDPFKGYESEEDDDISVREMERRMNVVDLVTRDADDDSDSVFENLSTGSPSTHSNFDGTPFMNAVSLDYRKKSESVLAVWEELLFEPPEPVPYNELNLSSENRRKGLSITNLEKYLSNEEFEQHLGTTREEFYRLPEFKRNDIKRKAKLF